MYLQLYQLQYIAWNHYIQSIIFISALPSFYWWLQYAHTKPWCLWLPHIYWQKICFCQQTPIFDIEHTKYYYRHQQALQIKQYLGSYLGIVTRDQRSKGAREQSNNFNSKTCTTKLELQAGSNCDSDSQLSSLFLFLCLPVTWFYSTMLYWLWYCQLPETGYRYSVVKFSNTETVLEVYTHVKSYAQYSTGIM